MHGARVVQIEGNFDQALRLVRDVKERYPMRLALVNSVNPHRIEGQKTAAFEICDALGRAPDYHLLPVGNAGNITAYWRGYKEYQAAPRSRPAAHDGIRGGRRRPDRARTGGRGAAHDRDRHPHRQPGELEGRRGGARRVRGTIDAITDDDILAAYRLLARTEGVFAEPASAISLAGALQLGASGGSARVTSSS